MAKRMVATRVVTRPMKMPKASQGCQKVEVEVFTAK